MAVIGEQNDVVLEKRSNSRSFLRKKSGQRSAIDEEAVVVFCLSEKRRYFESNPMQRVAKRGWGWRWESGS